MSCTFQKVWFLDWFINCYNKTWNCFVLCTIHLAGQTRKKIYSFLYFALFLNHIESDPKQPCSNLRAPLFRCQVSKDPLHLNVAFFQPWGMHLPSYCVMVTLSELPIRYFLSSFDISSTLPLLLASLLQFLSQVI